MNIKLFSKTSVFLVAGFILILTAGVWNETSAQTRIHTYLCSSDVSVGLAPNNTLRLLVYNPTANTIPGPHIKVFNGSATPLLSGSTGPIGPGEFGWFDIRYSDIPQVVAEGDTGRKQIRANIAISFTGLESDAPLLRPSWELTDTPTGQSILIGLLLPAVQKVR